MFETSVNQSLCCPGDGNVPVTFFFRGPLGVEPGGVRIAKRVRAISFFFTSPDTLRPVSRAAFHCPASRQPDDACQTPPFFVGEFHAVPAWAGVIQLRARRRPFVAFAPVSASRPSSTEC